MNHFWQYPLAMLVLSCSLLIAGGGQAADSRLVRDIRIEGLARTESATVLRELPFAEGSVWQPEFAETGERRLRNLGIFSEVRVAPPDADSRVTIYIKERWSLWLLPQASRKDNGSSSVSLVLDEYNLWGLNHHLKLGHRRETGTNFSNLTGSSSEFAYNWARVGDSRLSISVSSHWGRSLFDTYTLGITTAQYLQSSKSGGLTLAYALGPVPGEGWGVSLGYSGSNNTFQLLSGASQADVQGYRLRAVNGGISYRQINDHITWLAGCALITPFPWRTAASAPPLTVTARLSPCAVIIRSTGRTP